MPFIDARGSLLEQHLQHGVTLTGRLVLHHRPSAQHQGRSVEHAVVALIADLSRRPEPERGAATHSRDEAVPARGAAADAAADGVADDAPDDGDGSACFERLMARHVGVFEGAQRLKGIVDDQQLEALARMHETALAELGARHSQSWVDRTPFSAREAVVMEVVVATGVAATDVSVRLELALGAPPRTAFLREQVRSGAAPLWRACELVRATRELDDELADHVAHTVLAPTRDGAGLSGTLFRQRLRRALLSAGEDQAARRGAARQRIGAHAELLDDGTGRLTVINDAGAIVAAIDRADAAVRAARAAGDPRSLDQLRADYLTGAAITGWPDGDAGFVRSAPAPAGRAFVVVPLSTALGLDDEPCELPGHGFVGAEQARAIMTAPGSIWQTLLADVDTGRALGLSRCGYRPSREMVEHVRAVDGVCRGPGCSVPARQCDLDHDVPWPQGPTDVTNLTAKHRQHHRVRTAGWWDAARDELALVTWRTAAGRRYVTAPKDWLDGHRPGDRPSDHPGDRPGPATEPRGPDPFDPPPF